MKVFRLILACSPLFFLTACPGGENSGQKPDEPCTTSTYGLPQHDGSDVVLRGEWIPEPLEDPSFGLKISLSGEPVNTKEGTVRIWVMDEAFDPENPNYGFDLTETKVTDKLPTLAAQVRFPWFLCNGGFNYDESAKAVTLYILVDCNNKRYDGLATVPSTAGAKLFEYLVSIVDGKTEGYQPDVTGRTGFKSSGTTGGAIFDLAGDDEEVKFENPTGVTHPFEKIWLWRFTPDAPVGWPVPARATVLEYQAWTTGKTRYIVEDDFMNNATNGTCDVGDPVWVYSMVAVNDGGTIKYWQYKTFSSVTADPDADPVELVLIRKRNATGIPPE